MEQPFVDYLTFNWKRARWYICLIDFQVFIFDFRFISTISLAIYTQIFIIVSLPKIYLFERSKRCSIRLFFYLCYVQVHSVRVIKIFHS